MKHSKSTRIRTLLAAGAMAATGAVSSAMAQEDGPAITSPGDTQAQSAAQIQAYWTADRMANAIPRDIGTADGTPTVASAIGGLTADDKPMVLPGWNPNSGLPQPTDEDLIVLDVGEPSEENSTQAYGYNLPPGHPVDYADYGKYQRWTWYGRYTTYPTSTIGKVFFTLNGSNFVCSGTVVNRSTIATAGHCLSSGTGTWATSVLFCPSYNAGGVNPSRGCWAWTGYAATTSHWHNNRDFDRDYACFVTQINGTVINNRIGNVTGWAGMAYNWSARQMVFSTGYPAGSPFNGRNIIFTAAPEWYYMDRGGDANISRYIGNDMTGGSSGGGWFMGLEHQNSSVRVPDVDGSNITDPYPSNPIYWMGLNSHKRCRVNCSSPPTASAGVYWSEMGSPQITNSGSDNQDMADIRGLCASNGGS